MDLVCYLHPGWRPRVRPARQQRAWMDGAPESFAYRCLPLSIANTHGWEVATPCAVEAWWDGGAGVDSVRVMLEGEVDPASAAVSMFGQGVLTFHVAGLFRTPPGWNLWVGGPPNQAKDGIAPLSGLVETDSSPFTFTMNWQFTRANHMVRFEVDEAFAFIFPVERAALRPSSRGSRPWIPRRKYRPPFMSGAVPATPFKRIWRKTQLSSPRIAGRSTIIVGSTRAAAHMSRITVRSFTCGHFWTPLRQMKVPAKKGAPLDS